MTDPIYNCRMCQGTGVIVCPKCDGGGCELCFQWEGEVMCPDCNGSGKSYFGVCVHDFVIKQSETKDGGLKRVCTKCGKEE